MVAVTSHLSSQPQIPCASLSWNWEPSVIMYYLYLLFFSPLGYNLHDIRGHAGTQGPPVCTCRCSQNGIESGLLGSFKVPHVWLIHSLIHSFNNNTSPSLRTHFVSSPEDIPRCINSGVSFTPGVLLPFPSAPAPVDLSGPEPCVQVPGRPDSNICLLHCLPDLLIPGLLVLALKGPSHLHPPAHSCPVSVLPQCSPACCLTGLPALTQPDTVVLSWG